MAKIISSNNPNANIELLNKVFDQACMSDKFAGKKIFVWELYDDYIDDTLWLLLTAFGLTDTLIQFSDADEEL